MHNVTFDPETERRLEELAADKGLSPEELIQEAVTEHLGEAAEALEAEHAYQRYRLGEEGATSLEDLERDLRLDR